MRPSPLVLALLVLSASLVGAGLPGAVAVPGSGPHATVPPTSEATPSPTPMSSILDTNGSTVAENESSRRNRTNVLAIPEAAVQRSGIELVTLDLGPAVSFQSNASTIRMETLAIEARIEAAETDEERSRRILSALSGIETRVITLHQREQEAIDAYNRGAITARELMLRLAALSDRTDALEARLTMLNRLAKQTEGFSLDSSRVESLRFELRTFDGPVRDRAVAALTGEAPSTRIFVVTGPQGVVLTTLVNDTYVRESYRGALRNREGGSISASEALQTAADSYPTIWANRLSDGVEATGSGNTFVVQIPHQNGSLTAFVDAGSKRVFKEFQHIPLSTYEHRPAVTNVKSGLRLVVNRTYRGGPLRIHVEDADTGEPVDATITISQGAAEGTVIGQTGDDGTIWTLSPRGQFTVLAIHGQTAAVFLEVQPVEPPAIYH